MNSRRIKPEEAREMILAQLRRNGYEGRTSELAQWTGLPSSVVRRAGLFLANELRLQAQLMPGRGSGEYVFKLTQLDLFQDAKPETFWQRLKGWFRK